MGYKVEVVVVPDGDEKGIYVSPDAYKIDDAGLSKRTAIEVRWGRDIVIRHAALGDDALGGDACVHWNSTQDQWERLIGLVVCGLAERKFL